MFSHFIGIFISVHFSLLGLHISPQNADNREANQNEDKEFGYMKATGIVRRIDDLGRVVIPKEIRKTMRIREGDPLEIYTDKDGEVIFKKYSLMSGLSDFSSQLCETLNKTTGHVVAVTDRDTVIASAGVSKRELSGRRISDPLEQIMEKRQVFLRRTEETPIPLSSDSERFTIDVAAPILSEGDVLGSVIFVTGSLPYGETEYKLAQTVAGFLGKHMEA
jgi:AbrB family transcriptional regulator (stage V sporulation protein T)